MGLLSRRLVRRLGNFVGEYGGDDGVAVGICRCNCTVKMSVVNVGGFGDW